MRILVCGGRDFGDGDRVVAELHDLQVWGDLTGNPVEVVIHGKARGADTLADKAAGLLNIPTEVYPAEWDKYGKRAGYIRNQQMLDEGKPDLVVAFPGGRGTAMMVDIARKAGVKVREVKYGSNEEGSNEAADRASASPQGGPE